MWEKFKLKIKGWRTMTASAVLGVAGGLVSLYDYLIAAGVDVRVLLPDKVPAKYVGLIVALISALFAWLRYMTTGPVGTKEAN